MNSYTIILVAAIAFVGCTSVRSAILLPHALQSALAKEIDLKEPENTVMGQSLADLGIKICPDKLHLCPGTTDCCEIENGKWDCCPKASAPIAGECCTMWGIWTCCTSLLPKCHAWGCWWT